MHLPLNIVTVIGNPSARSRTRVVAHAIEGALDLALSPHAPLRLQRFELADLAADIGHTSVPSDVGPAGAAALRAIESADLLVAVTPVYKGSYTGLFKHLFDLVNPEALVARPVLLAANGGSERHALVVDHQLRPLFAFFRAQTVPSAVYAAEADFDGYAGIRSDALLARVSEAAAQTVPMLLQRFASSAEALRRAA